MTEATAGEQRRWGMVFLAVAAGMMAAAHLGKVPPVLPVIRAELGLDLVFGGWVVSIFAATAMTLGVFAGTVVDGLGYRRVMLVGLAAVSLGSAAGGFATNGAALLASRCLEGLGFLAVMVAGPILIANSTVGGDRRLALGIWGGNVPAGVAAMMLVSPLIADWAGWRTLWFVVAAASLGCLAFTAAATSREAQSSVPAPRGGSFAHNLRLTLTRPGPSLLTVAFGLNTVMWVGLIVWLPSFLIEERGLGAGTAATLSALVVAFSVAGNVLAGWLLQKGWARWVIIAVNGAAMGLAALGIFSEAVPDGARYGLCIVFSALGSMVPAAVLAGAPVYSPSPSQLGTTNGLVIQGANIGVFLGPPIVGALVARTGDWSAGVWLMLVASVATIVVALAIRRIEPSAAAGD